MALGKIFESLGGLFCPQKKYLNHLEASIALRKLFEPIRGLFCPQKIYLNHLEASIILRKKNLSQLEDYLAPRKKI